MATHSPHQWLGAECVGTAMLLATVIGSGIMGDRLAGGNVALALLGNAIPTGAILIVLITMLGPISGAHFNPAVTAVLPSKGKYRVLSCSVTFWRRLWVASSVCSPPMRCSTKRFCKLLRKFGPSQWFSEWLAALGLVLTMWLTLRANGAAMATSALGPGRMDRDRKSLADERRS